MTKPILSILFILAAIFSFVLYVRPTYETVREQKETAAQYDAALEKTREIQELKRSLLSRYNLFSGANLDRLQKMLPDHVDNVRLVLDMDGIASRYGMRIQDVTVEHAAQDTSANQNVLSGGSLGSESQYNALRLEFQVVATYENFLLLLQDLESSLRIVDLVSLSVKRGGTVGGISAFSSGDSTAAQQYTFNVALRTYWLK